MEIEVAEVLCVHAHLAYFSMVIKREICNFYVGGDERDKGPELVLPLPAMCICSPFRDPGHGADSCRPRHGLAAGRSHGGQRFLVATCREFFWCLRPKHIIV